MEGGGAVAAIMEFNTSAGASPFAMRPSKLSTISGDGCASKVEVFSGWVGSRFQNESRTANALATGDMGGKDGAGVEYPDEFDDEDVVVSSSSRERDEDTICLRFPEANVTRW